MEAHAAALVLYGVRLHLHTPGHQLGANKSRRHPVEHMVAGGGHIIRHLVFKGQHPLHIHVPRTCDEVFLVSVLAGELEADKVAAVIKALSVYKVILVLHPAGGLDLADALPLLCRHEIHADAGLCHAAAAKAVQIAVIFIGISGVFVLGEGGLVPVDHGVGAGPVIVRDAAHVIAGGRHLPHQAQQNCQRDDHQRLLPTGLPGCALLFCHGFSPLENFSLFIIPAFTALRNRA